MQAKAATIIEKEKKVVDASLVPTGPCTSMKKEDVNFTARLFQLRCFTKHFSVVVVPAQVQLSTLSRPPHTASHLP